MSDGEQAQADSGSDEPATLATPATPATETRGGGEQVRGTSVTRLDGAGGRRVERDLVAVEEPLEIRIGGRAATVTMRTPGHDEELARGFFFSEGLIRDADAIAAFHRPAPRRREEAGNLLDVELAPALAQIRPKSVERNFYATSSCGVCGKSSLEAVEVHAPPVESEARFDRAAVAALPDRLRAAQAAFALTGGLHAAALFDETGALLCVREDVGRHNAVDKVVGWALAAGRVPASACGLVVSGRTSFEILQKAAMAGVPVVAAVSAPSSLAVALADRLRITLVGFLRGATMNVYAHAQRIV